MFMILSENSTQKATEKYKKEGGATPRQLVHQQIENYDYHVTDEDIANMIISTETPTKTMAVRHERNADTAYDA